MASRERLQDDQLRMALQNRPGWSLANGRLRRELRFDGFAGAFAFMTRIAFEAERMNHNPEWFNVYDRVTIDLVTHDAGVTDLDLALADTIDRFAGDA